MHSSMIKREGLIRRINRPFTTRPLRCQSLRERSASEMAIPERGTRKEAEVETRRILYSVGSIRRAAELK